MARAAPTHGQSFPEAVLLWFRQVLGAVTAILLGTFAVLSWQVADQANELSKTANDKSDLANLVALVGLCAQITSGADWHPPSMRLVSSGGSKKSSLSSLCSGVEVAAASSISAIASSILGTITPITSTSPTTPTATSMSTSKGSTSGTTTAGGSSLSTQPVTSAGPGTDLDDRQRLGLGLGLGIGSAVAVISGLTLWAVIKKRHRPPVVPPKEPLLTSSVKHN